MADDNSGSFVQVMETFQNIGPILDMSVVDLDKQGQDLVSVFVCVRSDVYMCLYYVSMQVCILFPVYVHHVHCHACVVIYLSLSSPSLSITLSLPPSLPLSLSLSLSLSLPLFSLSLLHSLLPLSLFLSLSLLPPPDCLLLRLW